MKKKTCHLITIYLLKCKLLNNNFLKEIKFNIVFLCSKSSVIKVNELCI